MKYRLIELLACPVCGRDLSCNVFSTSMNSYNTCIDKVKCRSFCARHSLDLKMSIRPEIDCNVCFSEEIIDGELICACGAWFPIIEGIPRILSKGLLISVLNEYCQDYLEKYRVKLSVDPFKQNLGAYDIKFMTIRSFSYQWNKFSKIYTEYELHFQSTFLPLVEPQYFKGKLVFDAGCGFGRHLYFANQYGAEVIGMDMSTAVLSAYINNRGSPDVHIIQGDIYYLPFKQVFDFIYCVGVIQHLPNPREGFLRLTRLLSTGNAIYIWVYGKRKGLYRFVDLMRKVTTRIPLRILDVVAFICACVSHLCFVLPYKLLKRILFTRSLAEGIPFTRYSKYPFRVNHADWFDRLSVPSTVYFDRETVIDWFREAGLKDVKIVSHDLPGWKAFGIRK